MSDGCRWKKDDDSLVTYHYSNIISLGFPTIHLMNCNWTSGSHNTEILPDGASILFYFKLTTHDESYRYLCSSDSERSSDHYTHQYLGWTNEITPTQQWKATTHKQRPSQFPWLSATSFFRPPLTSHAELCTFISCYVSAWFSTCIYYTHTWAEKGNPQKYAIYTILL